jgi:S-adenosylmethionine synthetase
MNQINQIMARTALVTGASGLLGRQVMNAFQLAGWKVKGTGFTRAKPSTILKVDLTSDEVAKILNDVK